MLILILVVLFTFISCGNLDMFDANYTMGYIVIQEGEHYVLHTVASWSDSESDSVTVTTACCNNYIWTSVNNATLYRDKPSGRAYHMECGG